MTLDVPQRPARRAFIDWMRGLAVLCMIEHHNYDAWLDPVARASAASRAFRFLGGVAAPTFLFLAGLSSVLVLERAVARGATRSEACGAALRRAGVLLLGAYLFRFQEWALAFGGSPASDLLRVDILNAMAVALTAVALGWAAGRTVAQRVVLLTLAGALVAAAAPVVWAAPLSGWPAHLADYLHGRPPGALFPVFPWLAHAFGGALVGLAWSRIGRAEEPASAARPGRPRWSERRWMALVAGFGLALWLGTRLVEWLPGSVYTHVSFWEDSPDYVALRLASTIGLFCALWAVERALSAPAAAPVARALSWPLQILRKLGQHSLIVYWVHIEIVYGRWFWRARGTLSLAQATAALSAIVLSQVALAFAVTPLREALLRARARRQARRDALSLLATRPVDLAPSA